MIRVESNEQVPTLRKCVSCGELLTLDARVVPKNTIVVRTGLSKENMRTLTSELNSDLYNKITELARRENLDGNPSKIVNELL